MSKYSNTSDHELLPLLSAGDMAAFTEIYNRYFRQLLRTAHNILDDQDLAQDVVQNVFISMWNKRGQVQIGQLKPYLHQATRYTVLKQIRERKQDQGFYLRLAQITTDIITDNPLLFKEQQQLLQELIDTLPENCKETFRLSREENKTYKQIAEMLGISEKTVEKRISQALKHFRAGLSTATCVAVLTVLRS